MSKEMNVTHEGRKHFLNMAQAAILIGMAKSTFSRHWRQCELMGRSEQASFDWIKKRKYNPHKRAVTNTVREEAATARKETLVNKQIKPYSDMFLLGVINS